MSVVVHTLELITRKRSLENHWRIYFGRVILLKIDNIKSYAKEFVVTKALDARQNRMACLGLFDSMSTYVWLVVPHIFSCERVRVIRGSKSHFPRKDR